MGAKVLYQSARSTKTHGPSLFYGVHQSQQLEKTYTAFMQRQQTPCRGGAVRKSPSPREETLGRVLFFRRWNVPIGLWSPKGNDCSDGPQRVIILRVLFFPIGFEHTYQTVAFTVQGGEYPVGGTVEEARWQAEPVLPSWGGFSVGPHPGPAHGSRKWTWERP